MEIVGALLLTMIAIVVILVLVVGMFFMKVSAFGLPGKILAFAGAIIMIFVISFLVVLACLVTTLMLL